MAKCERTNAVLSISRNARLFLASSLQVHSRERAAARPLSAVVGPGMEKWTASVWLASQNVTAHLATALLDTTATDADELAILRALGGSITSPGALALRLEKGLQALATELLPKLQELARSDSSTGAELHDKFVQQGDAFTLQFGSLNTFFGGLEAKIGPPNRNIGQAMERDHLHSEDSSDEFTTSNYMMTTTPQIEWWFVAEPDRAVEWPKEGNIKEDGTSHATRRRPLPLSELKHRLHEVNAQLAVLEEPELMLEEGLGARLYTGPMFVKYNDLLRGFGAALAGCKSNRYVTTIHVINSVIVKASKLTKAATIYRGVAGGVLPQSFWAPNAQGVRGGIEGAFMSTTFDREVALQYASQPGKPGLVFEMHMGMIDRGCELGWISQYPHERECLFAPLTGIEVLGTRIEGAVLVVEARLSINLNALTIEQVISKRRKMVGDMCIAMQAEILHEARSEPSWAQLASAAVPLLPQLAATAAAAAKVLSRQAAGADVDDDQAAQLASTDILAAFIRDESHAKMNRFYTDEPERYNDDTYLSDTISNAINLKRAISSYPFALQQLAILHKMQDELCLRSIDVGASFAIESVTFNFNIGPPRHHGSDSYAYGSCLRTPQLEMHEGEYVIAVEQLMGYLALGAGIRFHTSVGRVLTVKAGLQPKGLVLPSNQDSCSRFDAPEGSQVVGLELSTMCPSCCFTCIPWWLFWLWLVVMWASPTRLVGLKVHKAPRVWHASDASATVHALGMLLQHKELHIGQRLTLALPDPQGKIAHGISALLLLSRTLTDLSFANLGFGPEPAKAIGAALGRNTTLTRLSIRHVRLGTAGAVEIFRGLQCTGSRLRHLILNHTSIDPACGAHVRAALLAPTALTELDLADNKLGPGGCEAVAEGLARNRSLEVLRLPNNVIEEAGVKAVADALITAGASSALRVLNLSKNPMGNQGGVFMGRALAHNPPLKDLRLGYDYHAEVSGFLPPFRYEIGDEGAIALVEGLRTNTNLIFLGLRGASITLQGSAELAHAMVINPELDVDYIWEEMARFDPLMLVPGCISVFGSQKRKTWWSYRMAQKLKQRQRRLIRLIPAVLGPLRSDLQEVLLRD